MATNWELHSYSFTDYRHNVTILIVNHNICKLRIKNGTHIYHISSVWNDDPISQCNFTSFYIVLKTEGGISFLESKWYYKLPSQQKVFKLELWWKHTIPQYKIPIVKRRGDPEHPHMLGKIHKHYWCLAGECFRAWRPVCGIRVRVRNSWKGPLILWHWILLIKIYLDRTRCDIKNW